MMTRNAMCNSLAVLVACSGLAMSSAAWAQNSQPVPTRQQDPNRTNQNQNQDRQVQDRDANRRDMNQDRDAKQMTDRKHLDKSRVRGPMAYFDDVNGATVRGSNGESVGTVEDVIFDRHSGEIAAYVVNAAGLNWGNDSRLLFPSELRPMLTDDGTVAFNVSVANPDTLRARLAFNKDAFGEDGTLDSRSSTWWNSFSNESDRNFNRADYYNEIYDNMNRNNNVNPDANRNRDNTNRDNTNRDRTGTGAAGTGTGTTGTGATGTGTTGAGRGTTGTGTTGTGASGTGTTHADNTPQGGAVGGPNPSATGGDSNINRDNQDRTGTRTADGNRDDRMHPIPGDGTKSGVRTGGQGPELDSNYTTWPYGRETYRQGAQPVQMRGTVSSTERMYGDGNSYYTVLTLRDDKGKEQRIVLGPSWYLADQKSMPMRGDNVSVDALEIEPINNTNYAANSMQIEGRDRLELRRGDKREPAWRSGTGTTNTDARRRSLLLASSIVGDDVKLRNDSSGEVNNLVLDLGTSRVLALVIDPNENFLGIGDTTRMIPVSVVTPSADDTVYVDATKEMILNAPEAPERLDANMNWNLDRQFEQNPVGYYSTSADR